MMLRSTCTLVTALAVQTRCYDAKMPLTARSRHTIPAIVAMVGDDLLSQQMAQYSALRVDGYP